MAVKRKAPPAKPMANRSAKTSGGTRRPPAPSGEESESGNESKADIFDKTKPQGAIDNGKYVALIGEMVLQKPDDNKRQSARVGYEIATEGEFQGQKVAQFYTIFEGEEPGKGLPFLKKDLAVLGYDDVKFGDLEAVFEDIVDKNVGVNVTVKQNGQFTNVYLNSLAEDSSVIDDYLAVRVF